MALKNKIIALRLLVYIEYVKVFKYMYIECIFCALHARNIQNMKQCNS